MRQNELKSLQFVNLDIRPRNEQVGRRHHSKVGGGDSWTKRCAIAFRQIEAEAKHTTTSAATEKFLRGNYEVFLRLENALIPRFPLSTFFSSTRNSCVLLVNGYFANVNRVVILERQ